MRRSVRFALGTAVGLAAVGGYLLVVGPATTAARVRAVTLSALVGVLALLVAEAMADGVGVWASMRPLGRGLSPRDSVRFALAGDFFDVVSPAGPVTSEPIMSRFFAVETATTYGEALGARTVAKYVKSGTQLVVSTLLVVGLLFAGPAPASLLGVMCGALAALVVLGGLLVRGRAAVSRVLVLLLTPVARRLSALYRERPHDREAVRSAVDRLWDRILEFRDRPALVGVIAVGAVLEQVLSATALWVALSGTGTAVALLPVVAVVPLPQVASVAPLPASLGAYDVLLGGVVALVTVATAPEAAAAVLVARTVAIGVSLSLGGVAVALLRGWRP